MTKKKHTRPKHQKDVSLGDTSEEECNTVNIQGKSCQHVTRAIHFGRVKKSLKSVHNITTCSGCPNENRNEEPPEVWLCLQCGYRGCGRMSENKHGLQHFKTLHSDCHSLVLSTTSGSVWCYDCDDEISLQSSRILKQCVEFVMKMSSDASNKSNVQNVNKFVPKQNLQNSVIKEENGVQNAEENGPVEKGIKPTKNNKDSSQKISIKGLRNLGNTCFFNAVMQNLNQTPLLFHELKNTCTPSHLWQLPELVVSNNEITENHNTAVQLSLPRQFPLANSLLNFLEQMQAVSSVKMDIVNPSPLFGEISKKCPQFRHFQQQDSHELLRQLLDGVRQEEIKRQKKAILRHFDLENVVPEEVDEELKKQIKAYGCYASHTIIEKVFGGLLISTVLCEECKASSQVFEPFMDLSLPLFEEKQQENNSELYGMLDGGKQDHIKPLRNKKNDCDSDDNAQGYVLSKPKDDTGKPSKHQEKKQRQLAKKDKKRAAKNSRNRKSSLNENCDKENEVQEIENERQDNEEEEEGGGSIKDGEQHSNSDHKDEETFEVPDLFSENEENSSDGHNLSTSPAKRNDGDFTKEELITNDSCDTNKLTEVNDTNGISDENKSLTNERIESDEFKPLSLGIHNGIEDPGHSMTEKSEEVGVEKYVLECSGKHIKESGDITIDCVEEQMDVQEKEKIEDVTKNIEIFSEDISLELEDSAAYRVKLDSEKLEANKTENIKMQTEEENTVDKCSQLEDILNSIKDFDVENEFESENLAADESIGSSALFDERILWHPFKNINMQREVERVTVDGCAEKEDISIQLKDIAQDCVKFESEILKVKKIEKVKMQMEEENGSVDGCSENRTQDVEQLKDSVEKAEVANDSVCELVEDFNNCLKIHSNPCNIDDRIQALSMQVKDVRIRRDSDRQENLLHSSESAEDWESQKTNCTSPKSSIEDSCSVENGDNWSHSISEQQTKDWISKTLTTLKSRHHVSPLECSINSCLSHFTKPELLTGNNKFRCENCTQLKIKKTGNKKDVVYSNASKQMLIFSPPAVLTLHLKRFQQVGMSLRKVNRFVEFPLILDLSPYCCSACSILPHMSSVEDEILYSLYGIVEHSGRLTSGHYTAYVKANKRTVNTLFECQLPLAQCDLEQLLRKFCGANKDSSQNKISENIKDDRQWFYISDSHVREASEAQVLKCQAYILFYERIK